MKLNAEIIVEDDVDLLYKTFKPDIKPWKRSKVKLKKTKNSLIFDIESNDAVALRATLNSITALLTVYEKTNKLIEKNGRSK